MILMNKKTLFLRGALRLSLPNSALGALGSHPAARMHRELGGDTAGTPNPHCPKGCARPGGVIPSTWSWRKRVGNCHC